MVPCSTGTNQSLRATELSSCANTPCVPHGQLGRSQVCERSRGGVDVTCRMCKAKHAPPVRTLGMLTAGVGTKERTADALSLVPVSRRNSMYPFSASGLSNAPAPRTCACCSSPAGSARPAGRNAKGVCEVQPPPPQPLLLAARSARPHVCERPHIYASAPLCAPSCRAWEEVAGRTERSSKLSDVVAQDPEVLLHAGSGTHTHARGWRI